MHVGIMARPGQEGMETDLKRAKREEEQAEASLKKKTKAVDPVDKESPKETDPLIEESVKKSDPVDKESAEETDPVDKESAKEAEKLFEVEKKVTKLIKVINELGVDEFGFSLVDGHKYVDGTRPSDFPPSGPDGFIRKEALGWNSENLPILSGRHALLRGRKLNGTLYSIPSLFLLKNFEGEHITFHLPDKYCYKLQYFMESLGKQMLQLMVQQSRKK